MSKALQLTAKIVDLERDLEAVSIELEHTEEVAAEACVDYFELAAMKSNIVASLNSVRKELEDVTNQK